MRILVVQESDWIEKGPHQSHHLFERLSKRGHEIRVIDFEISWRLHRKEILSKRKVFKNQHKAIKDGDISVIRPPIIKLPIFEYLSLIFTHEKEIQRQIKEFSPDVIIGFGILNASIAIRLARKNKIPFIYYIIDSLHKLVPNRFFQVVAKFVERRNTIKSGKVISINEGLREYTIRMGADREKTKVVRAGIDLKRYDPRIDGNKTREKYGIKKDDTVLFFMGWLYNFSGLREVASGLTGYRNTKFMVVGEGDAFEDLKKMSEKLGDRIILTGKRPFEKIPELISAADICLLPAYNNEIMRDIVPIKMYEYMAMGKPVIATKLPGVMKEFGDDNGVIYVDSPEDALKRAIELTDSGAIEEHGSKARKFVERYSWEDIVDNFREVLEEVVEVRGGK